MSSDDGFERIIKNQGSLDSLSICYAEAHSYLILRCKYLEGLMDSHLITMILTLSLDLFRNAGLTLDESFEDAMCSINAHFKNNEG